MASLRFSSFGAATVPLSKIIVDKDLDLRPHGVIARYCKAPVDPIVWPTEEIVIEPHDASDTVYPISDGIFIPSTAFTELFRFHTPVSPVSRIWTLFLVTSYSTTGKCTLKVTADGVLIHEFPNIGYEPTGVTYTLYLPGNAEVVVSGKRTSQSELRVRESTWYRYEGTVGRVIDLTGKWLALGLDMKELEANIKIQGVEMPYSDYAKYFPLAPTTLIMPEGWYDLEDKPEIRVYK